MKANVVPALQSKRGLRPVRRVDEPQVVGLSPQATKEKKADTMKTYLLKTSPAVEPKAKGKDVVIAGRDDFHIVPFIPSGSAYAPTASLGRPMTSSAFQAWLSETTSLGHRLSRGLITDAMERVPTADGCAW